MVIELADLLTLSAVVIVCWYFWTAQQVKEYALRATKNHCQLMDVQLLDQSIYLRAIWLKRDAEGKYRIWRSFNFEFTATGGDRYLGIIVLLGRAIEFIELEPHRL